MYMGAEGGRNASTKLAASAKLDDWAALYPADTKFSFGEVLNFDEAELYFLLEVLLCIARKMLAQNSASAKFGTSTKLNCIFLCGALRIIVRRPARKERESSISLRPEAVGRGSPDCVWVPCLDPIGCVL